MEKGDGYHGRKTATAQIGLTDRRWPMELRLTEPEVKLLREILDADLSGLLMEIARTDNRAMREGLKKRQDLLKEILDRLGGTVALAS